jgi:hypothetical protein
MSGTSRRIKYQKIKKNYHAVFEKFEKEHKKQVFLHLYRCKKRKIKKSGLCTFFRSVTRNPIKKNYENPLHGRLANASGMTDGRTDEAKIIGPFVLRTGTNNIKQTIWLKDNKRGKFVFSGPKPSKMFLCIVFMCVLLPNLVS